MALGGGEGNAWPASAVRRRRDPGDDGDACEV
jgi:hypothetical protein